LPPGDIRPFLAPDIGVTTVPFLWPQPHWLGFDLDQLVGQNKVSSGFVGVEDRASPRPNKGAAASLGGFSMKKLQKKHRMGPPLRQRRQTAREYAENIIATIRESLLVLDDELRIVSANHSFYETFQVTPAETKRRLLYEISQKQWDIPSLR
jgi:hypothetical protein